MISVSLSEVRAFITAEPKIARALTVILIANKLCGRLTQKLSCNVIAVHSDFYVAKGAVYQSSMLLYGRQCKVLDHDRDENRTNDRKTTTYEVKISIHEKVHLF